MRVMFSGSIGPAQQTLTRRLSARHDVRVIDPAEVDLTDPAAAAAAVRDVDAIVHGVVADPAATDDGARLYRASRTVYNLMTAGDGIDRFILLSSLRIFEDVPIDWRVTEDWRPRPSTDVDDLAVVAGEAVLREGVRVLPLKGIVLRLGDVVTDAAVGDPYAVHVDDALAALELALDFAPASIDSRHGWWPFHITGGGRFARFTPGVDTRRMLGYRPSIDVAGASAPVHRREVVPPDRSFTVLDEPRVTVYGAFGPLGAATADELHRDHRLMLTDVASVDEAARRPPFNRGAPLPHRVPGEHDYGVVDVRDAEAVLRAAAGSDVLVNLSTLRSDPALAFQVNAVGAYNVMRAAEQHGIGRVVHTGPEIVSAATTGRYAGGYWADFDIPSQVPPRVGTLVYFVSKLVGLEICRVFAERLGIQVPALLYGNFRNPDDADDDILDGFPICVSWRDGATAVRAAVRAPQLPPRVEVMTITADLPQQKVRNREAKQLLGWAPQDGFERFWRRTFDDTAGTGAE